MAAGSASAAPLGVVGDPLRGRYEFAFVGASFTESIDEGANQVNANCLKSSATAVVDPDLIPSRATLVQATLYLAGSLLDDGADGLLQEVVELTWPADSDAILALAQGDADLSVNFQPPGALAPIPVTADTNDLLIDVFEDPAPLPGTVAFFISRIDVTEEINELGLGAIAGDYVVSGFNADVCAGAEASCDASETCGTRHTKGNASFALLLVYEEPTLPVVALTVYEGLEALSNSSFSRTLILTSGQVSDPAAGSLSFYALEGDIAVASASNPPPCASQEYIEVDADAVPTVDGECLDDVDNPSGNLFNSTINTQPATSPPDQSCGRPLGQCCSDYSADTVCGEAGVDIDRFSISPALTPGATEIRFQFGTGSDRIAMAVVVLSINVFEPVLSFDTQVLVPGALDGFVRIGAPFQYSIAISNTGNATATGVRMLMSAPAFTENLAILHFPADGEDLSQQTAGASGNGLIRVEDFTIPPGTVGEIRAELVATCPALGEELTTELEVAFDQGAPFIVEAQPVTGAGPGLDDCDGLDPTGPFSGQTFVVRSLRGGGAPNCGASGTSVLGALAGVLLALRLVKRRDRSRRPLRPAALAPKTLWGAALLAALTFALLGGGCGRRRTDPPPPEQDPPRNIEDLAELQGVLCDSSGLSVRVTHDDLTTFCIDRFEASTDGGDLGNAQQGLTEDDPEVDPSTIAEATVGLALAPATGLSWYQAKSACLNAGKRLCTAEEWERACRGPAAKIYPYGNTLLPTACNGFFNFAEVNPSTTGSLKSCGSDFHVYDMSGNVAEWVEDRVDRIPGDAVPKDRLYRGGSYLSNASGLTCFGPEFHAPPGSDGADESRGFRCCQDD